MVFFLRISEFAAEALEEFSGFGRDFGEGTEGVFEVLDAFGGGVPDEGRLIGDGCEVFDHLFRFLLHEEEEEPPGEGVGSGFAAGFVEDGIRAEEGGEREIGVFLELSEEIAGARGVEGADVFPAGAAVEIRRFKIHRESFGEPQGIVGETSLESAIEGELMSRFVHDCGDLFGDAVEGSSGSLTRGDIVEDDPVHHDGEIAARLGDHGIEFVGGVFAVVVAIPEDEDGEFLFGFDEGEFQFFPEGFEGLVEAKEEIAATVEEFAVDITAEEEVAAFDDAEGGGEFALEFLLELFGGEELERIGVGFAGFDLFGSERPEAVGLGAEEDTSVLGCG